MNDYCNPERGMDKELARAYVPFQVMNQVYSPCEALKNGTLFPELYRPCWDTYKGKTGGHYNG